MFISLVTYIFALQLIAKERLSWQWGGALIATLPYSVLIVTGMIGLSARHQPLLYAFTPHNIVTFILQLIVALFICLVLSRTDDLTTWLIAGGLGLFCVVFAVPYITSPLI